MRSQVELTHDLMRGLVLIPAANRFLLNSTKCSSSSFTTTKRSYQYIHEMIHAFLFLSSGVRDHDDHGPSFQGHMTRINSIAKTKITVFHTFHQEVDAYRLHWWQCDGICRTKKPYFGLVKRAMNRPPSKRDTWWAEHQRSCGGTFTKIKEPEDYKKKKVRKVTSGKKLGTNSDITSYFIKAHKDVSKQQTEGSSKAKATKQSSILADRKIVLIDLTKEA